MTNLTLPQSESEKCHQAKVGEMVTVFVAVDPQPPKVSGGFEMAAHLSEVTGEWHFVAERYHPETFDNPPALEEHLWRKLYHPFGPIGGTVEVGHIRYSPGFVAGAKIKLKLHSVTVTERDGKFGWEAELERIG